MQTANTQKVFVDKNVVVIDVRTVEEFQGGHFPNSVNIPLDQIDTALTRFPKKEAKIIVCCQRGGRAQRAKEFLEGRGYTNVENGGPWDCLSSTPNP